MRIANCIGLFVASNSKTHICAPFVLKGFKTDSCIIVTQVAVKSWNVTNIVTITGKKSAR